MQAVRASYLAAGALIAIMLPFLAPVLERRGFSATDIGLVLAVVAAGNVLALPAWGHLGDVLLGRRRALQVAAAGAAAAALAFGLASSVVAVALTLITYLLLTAGCSTLLDAIAVNAVAARPELYGRFRVLMSISYALVALAVGSLYTAAGYGMASVLAAACAAIVVVVVAGVPDVARADLLVYTESPDPMPTPRPRRPSDALGSIGVAVRIAPRLIGVMAAIVVGSIGYTAAGAFLPLRLVEVGATPAIVAFSSTIGALAEVPAMLVATRLVRPVGLRGLGVAACVLYAVALGSWVILDDPFQIATTRVLLGFGFGTLTVTGVLTVGSMLPPRLQASGQALLGVSTAGIASTIAALAGGIVYDRAGHVPFFALAAISAVTASFIAWAYLPARGTVRPVERA